MKVTQKAIATFPWLARVPMEVLRSGTIQDVGRYKYLVEKALVVLSKRNPDKNAVAQVETEFNGLIESINKRVNNGSKDQTA